MSTRSPLSSTANQPSLNRKLKIDVHHRDVPVVEADENRDDLLTAEPFPQELLHQDEFTHLDGLPPAEQIMELREQCCNLQDKAWAINDKAAQDESYIDNLKLLLRSARTSYEKLEQELFAVRQGYENLHKIHDQTRSSLSHVSLLYKVSTETIRSLETKLQQQSQSIQPLHLPREQGRLLSRKRKSLPPPPPSFSSHSPFASRSIYPLNSNSKPLHSRSPRTDMNTQPDSEPIADVHHGTEGGEEMIVVGTQPDSDDGVGVGDAHKSQSVIFAAVVSPRIGEEATPSPSPSRMLSFYKQQHTSKERADHTDVDVVSVAAPFSLAPPSASLSVATSTTSFSSPCSPPDSVLSSALSVSGDEMMLLSPTPSVTDSERYTSTFGHTPASKSSVASSSSSSRHTFAKESHSSRPYSSHDTGEGDEDLSQLQFIHSQLTEHSASGSPKRESQRLTLSQRKRESADVIVIDETEEVAPSSQPQPNTTKGQQALEVSQLSQLVPRRLSFTEGEDREDRETGDRSHSKSGKSFNLQRSQSPEVVGVSAGAVASTSRLDGQSLRLQRKQHGIIDQDPTSVHQRELTRLHQYYEELLQSKESQYSLLSIEYQQFKATQTQVVTGCQQSVTQQENNQVLESDGRHQQAQARPQVDK